MQSHSDCVALVSSCTKIFELFFRVNDFENYLCTLQLPKHARSTGFAVRAFNVEVAKVRLY